MNNLNVDHITDLCKHFESEYTKDVYIIRCTRGEATFIINAQRHTIKAGQSFVLLDGITFKVQNQSSDLRIILYTIGYDFFTEVTLLCDNIIFRVLALSVPNIVSSNKLKFSHSLLDNIAYLVNQKFYVYKAKSIANLLESYIHDYFNILYPLVIDRLNDSNNNDEFLISKFYNDVLKYKKRSVSFYAEKLNISKRHFFTITQRTMRLTPGNLITEVITAFIKSSLATTNQTMSQIAEELEFPDISSMGQFFKRHTGISPSQYRKEHKL